MILSIQHYNSHFFNPFLYRIINLSKKLPITVSSPYTIRYPTYSIYKLFSIFETSSAISSPQQSGFLHIFIHLIFYIMFSANDSRLSHIYVSIFKIFTSYNQPIIQLSAIRFHFYLVLQSTSCPEDTIFQKRKIGTTRIPVCFTLN